MSQMSGGTTATKGTTFGQTTGRHSSCSPRGSIDVGSSYGDAVPRSGTPGKVIQRPKASADNSSAYGGDCRGLRGLKMIGKMAISVAVAEVEPRITYSVGVEIKS